MLLTNWDNPQLQSGRVGLVPTMGALHEGHASLIALARQHCDVVVVSVFVNPLQFGDADDYQNYPRDLDNDYTFARKAGADIIFAPSVDYMYPDGDPAISVTTGHMGRVLEGESRPGHFDGVATVVAKLFNLIRPDIAVFGAKDAQQLAIVNRLVKDLNLGVKIVAAPLIRDADGLALSSRNLRLSPDDRTQALSLSRALFSLRDNSVSLDDARKTLQAHPGINLDYLTIVDPETFLPTSARPALALGAVRVGPVRLIDALTLE